MLRQAHFLSLVACIFSALDAFLWTNKHADTLANQAQKNLHFGSEADTRKSNTNCSSASTACMEMRGLRFLGSKATQQRKTSSSFTQHSGRPDLHFHSAKRPNFCRNKQSRAEAQEQKQQQQHHSPGSAGFSSGARHKKRLPTAEKRHQPQIGRSDRHQPCPWPSRELSWLPAQPNSSTLSAIRLSLRFFSRHCPARILPPHRHPHPSASL